MPTELQTKLRLLAGATVPCKNCGGVGALMSAGLLNPPTEPSVVCEICKGTGRVYLFGDEVRRLCPQWPLRHGPMEGGYGCGVCNGTDWVPSEDGWVWLQAVDLARRGPNFILEVLHNSTQGSEHFASVVLRLLQTIEGVQLG